MAKPGLVIAVVASLVFAGVAVAQIAPDDLVITGAGWGKGWDTEIELADSETGTGTTGSVWITTGLTGPCPPICENVAYSIPPKGTIRLLVSETFPFIQSLLTVHVTTDTEQPLPIVRARVFNGAVASQSAEIPVFRNPTVSPRSFAVFVFPGLRRQPGVYGNLVLQSKGGPPTGVLVEAFGPDGQLLGSETVMTTRFVGSPLVLVDVASRLGISEVDGGQVRVTNSSGEILWGVLATVYADGRLSVVPGANP